MINLINGIPSKSSVKKWIWWGYLMCGSFHLDMALNVEIGVEYKMIFVVVFFKWCFEMYFGAPSRYRKGCVISIKILQSNSTFLSCNPAKNKRVNKHFKIWCQFQNSTSHPNDMIHTLVQFSPKIDKKILQHSLLSFFIIKTNLKF